MLNVANLEPVYFKRFLSGQKKIETRWRTRVDARLEAIEVGEPIVLLEIGSERGLRGVIGSVTRRDYTDGYLYKIRVQSPVLFRAPGVRKIQGWHRRKDLRN